MSISYTVSITFPPCRFPKCPLKCFHTFIHKKLTEPYYTHAQGAVTSYAQIAEVIEGEDISSQTYFVGKIGYFAAGLRSKALASRERL